MQPFPNKAPGDRLDYAFDFTDALVSAAETVVSGTVTVDPVGLVVESVAVSLGQVVAWISGGTAGVTYRLTSLATTAEGRALPLREVRLHVGSVGLDDSAPVGATQ